MVFLPRLPVSALPVLLLSVEADRFPA